MMTVKEIREWLRGKDKETLIGIDDGGLCLRTVEENGEDWLEIGGIPEEEEEEE